MTLPGFSGDGLTGSGLTGGQSSPRPADGGGDIFSPISGPVSPVPQGRRLEMNEDDAARARVYNALPDDDGPRRPRVFAELALTLAAMSIVLVALAPALLRTGITLDAVPAAVVGLAIAAVIVVGGVAAWLRAKSAIIGGVFVGLLVFLSAMAGTLFIAAVAG